MDGVRGEGPAPVLVTGANGVLTSAVAGRLAARYPLLLHHHRREDRLRTAGLWEWPRVVADLASAEDVERLAGAARSRAPLAGMVLGASAFQRTTLGEGGSIGRVLQLELGAHLELVHRLHDVILDGGRILLFSDAGARLGWPSYDVYLAAKCGLECALRSLARVLGPRLVLFGVAPGLVEGSAPAPAHVSESQVCLGRAARPSEVAEAILRAWDLPAGVIHGQVLRIDGGWFSPF